MHGSAPDIAGQDIANPSGVLMSAVMMLVHLDRSAPATLIHNAWLRTLEDGLHTADIHREGVSRKKVGTHEFAQAVIARLGQTPVRLPAVAYADHEPNSLTHPEPESRPRIPARKALVGVDIFLNWDEDGRDANKLGPRIASLAGPQFALALITNRGVKVYPQGLPQTLRSDHWRCRFKATDPGSATPQAICALLLRIAAAGLDAVKTENLYEFDGERGYSQAQGE